MNEIQKKREKKTTQIKNKRNKQKTTTTKTTITKKIKQLTMYERLKLICTCKLSINLCTFGFESTIISLYTSYFPYDE